MSSIVIIATLTLNASADESVLSALKALHEATHKNDEGCLQYDLHEDKENKHTYVFVETWQSEALLKAHMEKPHFKAFQEALEGKIERMSIQTLDKLL